MGNAVRIRLSNGVEAIVGEGGTVTVEADLYLGVAPGSAFIEMDAVGRITAVIQVVEIIIDESGS